MSDIIIEKNQKDIVIESKVTTVSGICPTSSDPGIANVLLGVSYEINDVDLVGTLIYSAPAGRQYVLPNFRSNTHPVSYATGDAHWMFTNGEFDRADLANPLIRVQLDREATYPNVTLLENNIFGNKARFTNSLGWYLLKDVWYNRNVYVNGDLVDAAGTPINAVAQSTAVGLFRADSEIIIDHLHGTEWSQKNYNGFVGGNNTPGYWSNGITEIRGLTYEGGGWKPPTVGAQVSFGGSPYDGAMYTGIFVALNDSQIATCDTDYNNTTQFWMTQRNFDPAALYAKTHSYADRWNWAWRFIDESRWV
tara:strand:- start:14460 stop:15380 length:921 start_codon:yes stop_codon:yes gene_type:complete